MEKIDIVYVSYNSEKWVDKCFDSLVRSNYNLNNINVFVVDNASTDNTVQKLKQTKMKIGNILGGFTVIESNQNLGFGKANNLGFSKGSSSIVLFLNIDTELFENTLMSMKQEVDTSKDEIALWEMRQFPYEHPKLYDPVTQEVSWCSGAAFAIRRSAYDEIGGFEEKIFMYAEDVDLSWRLRSYGYKLKYCPKVMIMHYSYEEVGEIKPSQYTYSLINNLLLRYRFGAIGDIIEWYNMFFKILRAPRAFKGAKKAIISELVKAWKKPLYFRYNRKLGNYSGFNPKFVGFDYETIRKGAFYENQLPKEKPLVSIIVRTCGRPAVLRETLISLRNQTYENIEIVIVEDGEDISREIIENEFYDLNIVYYATRNKVGRSKAGNLAMKMAKGKYLNFLDDDDVFYADHVEVLVYNLEISSCKAAYAMGYETPIEIISKDPYEYKIYNYLGVHKQKFDKLILCHHNYIPIQCIMFEKTLFEDYGGLDETLDALEDWDLWVRYSLHTDFEFVNKTTSLYRTPHIKSINKKRQKILDDTLNVVREKHKDYIQKISVYELAQLYRE